jgi:hypothetical protein
MGARNYNLPIRVRGARNYNLPIRVRGARNYNLPIRVRYRIFRKLDSSGPVT